MAQNEEKVQNVKFSFEFWWVRVICEKNKY